MRSIRTDMLAGVRRLRPPSIRTLIALVVVLPIVAASAALVALNTITSRRIAEDLARQVVDAATAQVQGQVQHFLAQAIRVSDLYDRRIRDGVLPIAGLQAWERVMLDDLVTSPDVASISFGNVRGDCTWLLRGKGQLEIGRVDGEGGNHAVEFRVTPDGAIDPAPIREYTYDPRRRPWWEAAVTAGEPVWTPVYFWFGNQGAASETGAGFTRPVHDQAGELQGVLVVDVTLGALSDFLRSLPLAHQGYIFIVDQDHRLVAASHGPVNSDDGRRLTAAESGSAAAQAVAELLDSDIQDEPQHHDQSDSERLHKVHLGRDAARLRITTIEPHRGIRWRIAAVIPEAAFLADAAAEQRRAILMAAIAVVGSVVLGVRLSRQISRPMLDLTSHVQRVGRGDFDARLDLQAARELTALSHELNSMAAGLRHRMELQQSLALAMQVQQSLLPQRPPSIAGLDVAGQSRYCDETGGDYFDFLDVSPIGDQRLLVAVGDVMGHGIAAALLMASARAALRAHADDQGSLATLMTRINLVLAKDVRHGRFMTMMLLMIERADGPNGVTARWASAGHDPTFLYDPATDGFTELGDGGLPLGVMEDTDYQEYRRDAIPAGAMLVIGTDGIWEMPSPAGERFGKERLCEFIRANHARSAAEFSAELERTLIEFRGEHRAEDDVTFVVVKIV